ncbi:MAG: SdiA-regulated domain-containing protein, partial [Bacteroidia bacterium]
MSNVKKYAPWLVLILAVAISIGYLIKSGHYNDGDDYNFSSPDKIFKLPHVLKEISGITTTDKNEIACVQDEIGTIFIYDIVSEQLVNEYKNNLTGDFEGIALVKNTMYILRSDGVLVEYSNYKSENEDAKEYNLNLPTANNEGLCYDKKNNCLLIAAKSKTEDGLEKKSIRLIYSFNLQTKEVAPEPIIKLHIKRIEEKAIQLHLIEDKVKKHKKDKDKDKDESFNFRPSEIAVNPIDNSIYILSGKDKMLLIMDQKDVIKDLIFLNPDYFNQAEGMTFLSNGDLLISNEGQKGKPTLLL